MFEKVGVVLLGFTLLFLTVGMVDVASANPMEGKGPYMELVLTKKQAPLISDPGKILTSHIHTEINDNSVKDAVTKLTHAEAGTIMYLFMNSPGGSLYAGLDLISAMESTKAYVIVVIDTKAASMATLIAFAADKINAKPGAYFLFHFGTVFLEGNKPVTVEQHSPYPEVQEFYEYIVKLDTEIFGNILTVREFNLMKDGEDVVIAFKTVKARYDDLMCHRDPNKTLKWSCER
jgi:hypothetical protein